MLLLKFDQMIYSFSEYRRDKTWVDVKLHNLYEWFSTKQGEYVDRIGKGQRDGSQPRAPRKFTFYRLRDFVKTTISDLGYSDYAEWLIGHSGSTYYSQTKAKQIEMFRKIEPYLTFLDVVSLEARGADHQTRLDQMQVELQREREERAKLYELLYKQGII